MGFTSCHIFILKFKIFLPNGNEVMSTDSFILMTFLRFSSLLKSYVLNFEMSKKITIWGNRRNLVYLQIIKNDYRKVIINDKMVHQHCQRIISMHASRLLKYFGRFHYKVPCNEST